MVLLMSDLWIDRLTYAKVKSVNSDVVLTFAQ